MIIVSDAKAFGYKLIIIVLCVVVCILIANIVRVNNTEHRNVEKIIDTVTIHDTLTLHDTIYLTRQNAFKSETIADKDSIVNTLNN